MFLENFKASHEYFLFHNSSLVGENSVKLAFLSYGRTRKDSRHGCNHCFFKIGDFTDLHLTKVLILIRIYRNNGNCSHAMIQRDLDLEAYVSFIAGTDTNISRKRFIKVK